MKSCRDWKSIVALMCAALVVGLAYLFGGFIPRHEWLIAPAAMLCLAAAFWCGLSRSTSVTPQGRLRSATMWGLVVVALMALPAGGRWAWLQREVRTIPVPADADDVQRQTNVVLWRRYLPPYSVRYVTRLSFEEADAFLMQGFVANGWEIGRRSPEYEYTRTSFPNAFLADSRGRPPVAGRLRNYTIIHVGYDRYMNVTLFDAGEERWVDCDVQSDEPPHALRHFWW